MRRSSIALFAVMLCAAPLSVVGPEAARAQTGGGITEADTGEAVLQPDLEALLTRMGLYDVLGIMVAEGMQSAPDLEAELFPGQGGAAWMTTAAGIYDRDRLIARFEAALPVDLLSDDALAELREFFDSDLGGRIVEGELAARRAFLDPDVKDAATAYAQERAAEADPRLDLLTEFIAVNDLVDRNVSGALNSNFAFYHGLSESGAFDQDIPESMMLAEIWSQEPEIRRDTLDWLYAYQLMAYQGLSDADLARYIDVTRTPAGRALNAMLFAGFDVVFEGVSRALGQAAAGFMRGQEL